MACICVRLRPLLLGLGDTSARPEFISWQSAALLAAPVPKIPNLVPPPKRKCYRTLQSGSQRSSSHVIFIKSEPAAGAMASSPFPSGTAGRARSLGSGGCLSKLCHWDGWVSNSFCLFLSDSPGMLRARTSCRGMWSSEMRRSCSFRFTVTAHTMTREGQKDRPLRKSIGTGDEVQLLLCQKAETQKPTS